MANEQNQQGQAGLGLGETAAAPAQSPAQKVRAAAASARQPDRTPERAAAPASEDGGDAARAPGVPQVRRGADGRAEVVLPDGTILRRNRTGAADSFYVPPHIIPAGWSYQWNAVTVYGERQTAQQVQAMENGWRPVPAERHDGVFMPPGFKGAIERDGQMLMERPLVLTQEAQDEEKRKADGLINMQKEAIGQKLPEGFENKHRKVVPTIRTNYERSTVDRPQLEIADDQVA